MSMRRMVIFIGCWLLVACSPLLAQKDVTNPFIQVHGNLSWLNGTDLSAQSQPGLGAAIGMWSQKSGNLEWLMLAQYQLLRVQTTGLVREGLTTSDSALYTLQSHQIDWTTLAIYHLIKPALNLQGGVWVGAGLGGNEPLPDLRLGQAEGLLVRDFQERGQLGYGLVMGLGFGSRHVQGHIRYVWDARDKDPRSRQRLRRGWVQAGVAFLFEDWRVF